MSSNKHAIVGTAITSTIALLFTYLASVNFGYKNTIPWLSNEFLLAVFGGIFASAFVVMLCEIQKYRINKSTAEYALYSNAIILFSQVVVMQNTIMQSLKRPDEKVVYGALNNCIQISFGVIQNIFVCDYNPFLRKRNRLLKALIAFRKDEAQINGILNESRCYYDVAINNSIIKHIDHYEPQDVFGNDELIQKTAKVLMSRLEKLKEICDALLIGIDYKGKYQWNNKKQNIDLQSVDLIRALDLEGYLEKYKSCWSK